MYVIIPIEIYIQISMYIPLNIWYNIRGLLRDRGTTHYVSAVGASDSVSVPCLAWLGSLVLCV